MPRIEASYLASDQRRFFCKCPHCGNKDWLRWARVIWDKDRDSSGKVIRHKVETATIQCEACNQAWTEQQRIDAVKAGEWIPTRPEIRGHKGYHLSALYVLLPCPENRSSWMEEFASRFLEAKAIGVQGLKPFTNLILAETWAPERHLPPQPIRLYERREQYAENANELVLMQRVVYFQSAAMPTKSSIHAPRHALELNETVH